jgi:hypothetical protein
MKYFIFIVILFAVLLVYNNKRNFTLLYPKIDIVYTWVDGTDNNWKEMKDKYTGEPKSDSIFRYNNVNELKYSLRSIYNYAPWANNIYIVVDDIQTPPFVNINNPKIKIVKHSEIIPKEYLPTFNSVAIETSLHHIPGLEENFLYFNDDMFLGNDTTPGDIYDKCYYRGGYTFSELTPSDGEWICNMKNDYLLLKSKFPDTKYIVPWHQAYFCKKSLMYELEKMFPENYQHTIAQKLRKQSSAYVCESICLPTMQFNLGVLKGIYEFLPDTISFGMEMGHQNISEIKDNLETIKKNKPKFFCINANVHNDMLRTFLDSFFPDKCPYEV